MPKTAITQWDSDPAGNTDINGINIAENCPAAGINNAIRTMMAQIASWISGVVLKSGAAMTGDLTDLGAGSTVKDPGGTARTIGYRQIPSNPQTGAYVLALADVGKCIDITTGGVTVPANSSVAFAVGDTIAAYNGSSSNQTISPASGVTLRLAGTATTGARTMAQRGWVTLRKVGADEWISSGAGLS
jgi:hypothetical protein